MDPSYTREDRAELGWVKLDSGAQWHPVEGGSTVEQGLHGRDRTCQDLKDQGLPWKYSQGNISLEEEAREPESH